MKCNRRFYSVKIFMIFYTVYQILLFFCDFLLFDKIIRDNFFKD